MELYKIEIFSVRKKNPIRAEEYISWEAFVKQAHKYNVEINAEDYKYYAYNSGSNSWDTLELTNIQQHNNQE